MYWIDVLSRLQLVSFFFFVSGLVSAITILAALFVDDSIDWKSLTRMVIITFILFLISALVAFFAPSAEYIEYLKNNFCINN